MSWGVGTVAGECVEVNVGEDDDKADGEEIIEATEEDADQKEVIPTPELPTLSEMEKHREDYIPYASWCDQCVEGRGREFAHKRSDHSHRQVATLSFDYLFVTDGGVFTRGEAEAMG